MPDVVFMSSYLPNTLLASCYEGVSDGLPFDPIEAPVSSFARVVSEVAIRAFNALVLVYSGGCLVVFTLPEFVIMNIDLIMRHSLFSLQILKANWLFVKIIAVGLAAQCSAFIAGRVPYALGALHQVQNAIIEITVAELDELPRLAASKDISLTQLPDGGARLLNETTCNWRSELNQEIARHLGGSTDHGEFWKPALFPLKEGLRALLLRHYTQAEVTAAQQVQDWRAELATQMEAVRALLLQFENAEVLQPQNRVPNQTNEIKECQLAFHPIYYDALKNAAKELVEKRVYESDDIAVMFGSPFYGTMGLALLRLIQKAGYNQGLIPLQGDKGEQLKLKPFSTAPENNFQSIGELLASLIKGVDVCAFDAPRTWNKEQIKQLRAAVKAGCVEPVVNGLQDKQVREFAQLLRTNPRDRHEFELWNMYEPNTIQNFSGTRNMTTEEIQELEKALITHSGEKIPKEHPQVVYAFRIFQHIIESVIMRRVINTNRYSPEQERGLPQFNFAFAGESR